MPFVVVQEQAEIKGEIMESVIFDGTTRLEEARAIVRFIDKSFNTEKHLVHLQLLSKSTSGEETARELINTLSTQFGISCNLVVVMHDHASCNGSPAVAITLPRAKQATIITVSLSEVLHPISIQDWLHKYALVVMFH